MQKNQTVLINKHIDFKAALETLAAAQRQLDEYLRLEKVDEKIFNSMLAAIGISKKQVDAAVGDLDNAITAVSTTVQSIKDLTKSVRSTN